MDISNISWTSGNNKRQNSPLLPKSIRAVLIGKSNSVKTVLLLNLLLQPNFLDYDHLYVLFFCR